VLCPAGASVALVLCLALLAAGCGGKSQSTSPGTVSPATGKRTFTTEELAAFSGQNGQPAYVAVDGVVYDVTGSPNWPGGTHTKCPLDASAGKDLSQVLQQAPPRMRAYITAKPVVGKLKGS
jgi:predicted heme/steroid binding protein